MFVFFFFKQKTAYEMRISDWSSDVCSSDLAQARDCDPVVGGGLRAALEEMRLSADALHDPEGLKERVASSLERIDAARGRLMGRSTGLLATIGSIAPFVGLFGTVWGIMNAFIGISEAPTTNLAVVATGIAEALLATAPGLVAALTAVDVSD